MRLSPGLVRGMRFTLLLLASWCVMTTVHESGHVVSGWAGGGTLREADLAPWGLPYSRFDPDPHPLMTVWGGPALGVAVPVVGAIILRQESVWFVAWFCVLANGCYLASAWASGERMLDTARLFQHGARPATVAVYCAVTIGVGYVKFRQACVRALTPDLTLAWPATGPGRSGRSN